MLVEKSFTANRYDGFGLVGWKHSVIHYVLQSCIEFQMKSHNIYGILLVFHENFRKMMIAILFDSRFMHGCTDWSRIYSIR